MEVRTVARDELDLILPLIADYQRFCGTEPDHVRNAEFFARFVSPSDDGLLIAAFGAEPLGHACLYWTFSSVHAVEVVLLNDLYVRGDQRGRGVGKALIDATVAIARDRGAGYVRWYTRPDNERAQRLYDRTGSQRSSWVEYELNV